MMRATGYFGFQFFVEGASFASLSSEGACKWPTMVRWLEDSNALRGFLQELRTATKQWVARNRAAGRLQVEVGPADRAVARLARPVRRGKRGDGTGGQNSAVRLVALGALEVALDAVEDELRFRRRPLKA